MIRLKQSTASQEIPLGHFVDSVDGNTEETGLTIANTDIKLWKMGATTLASKNSGGATHISNGVYYCVLDATDTDTLGALVVFVHVSGALAVKVNCEVLAANVYDSLVAATDKLEADVAQWLGTAPLSLSSQQVQAVVPNTQKVDVETIKTRAITAAGAVVVGGFVGQDTAAIGVNASGHVSRVVLTDTATNLTNAVTVGTINNGVITANSIAASALNGKGDWATSAVGSDTLDNVLQDIWAVLLGKTTVDESTITFLGLDGSTARIEITYGSDDGERTASERQ